MIIIIKCHNVIPGIYQNVGTLCLEPPFKSLKKTEDQRKGRTRDTVSFILAW